MDTPIDPLPWIQANLAALPQNCVVTIEIKDVPFGPEVSTMLKAIPCNIGLIIGSETRAQSMYQLISSEGMLPSLTSICCHVPLNTVEGLAHAIRARFSHAEWTPQSLQVTFDSKPEPGALASFHTMMGDVNALVAIDEMHYQV
jgi:hypothetical protein